MSHYWDLKGQITFDRNLTVEELQAVADELDTDIGSLEFEVGWNNSESIQIQGNKLFLILIGDILELS